MRAALTKLSQCKQTINKISSLSAKVPLPNQVPRHVASDTGNKKKKKKCATSNVFTANGVCKKSYTNEKALSHYHACVIFLERQ